MLQKYKYYRVGVSGIKAIVGVNKENDRIKTIRCSNMKSCDGYDFENKKCPDYCHIITEAKNYATKGCSSSGKVKEVIHQEEKNFRFSIKCLINHN